MVTEAIVIMITAPSKEVGEQIASTLLEKRLVACINILPAVQSFYEWKGEVHVDEEVLLIIKSRAELFADQIVGTIKAIHPYEVPEIIALPIVMGSEDYMQWIGEVTSNGS